MVKTYGDLYLDTRRALLNSEDAQAAGIVARMLICHVSGKSQADFLARHTHRKPLSGRLRTVYPG